MDEKYITPNISQSKQSKADFMKFSEDTTSALAETKALLCKKKILKCCRILSGISLGYGAFQWKYKK